MKGAKGERGVTGFPGFRGEESSLPDNIFEEAFGGQKGENYRVIHCIADRTLFYIIRGNVSLSRGYRI